MSHTNQPHQHDCITPMRGSAAMPRQRWNLFLHWIGLHIGGGLLTMAGIGYTPRTDYDDLRFMIVGGLIILLLFIAQFFMLRRSFCRMGLWVPLSIGGGIVANAFGITWGWGLSHPWLILLAGIGIGQMMVLCLSRWLGMLWLPIHMGASSAALALVRVIYPLTLPENQTGLWAGVWGLGAAGMAGMAYGGITGIALLLFHIQFVHPRWGTPGQQPWWHDLTAMTYAVFSVLILLSIAVMIVA